ncbi:terpene synthase family protein [Streptomyces sp. NPDC054871]
MDLKQQTRLNVPTLYCPFPASRHSHAPAIDKAASQWMRACAIPQEPDLRERLLRSKCSYLSSGSSPHADIERLQVAGRFVYLGFAYDDWFESRTSLDEVVTVCSALQRAQEAPDAALTDVPFLPSFLDVMGGFRRMATPTQYRRLVEGQRAYFQAIPWEASYRLRGKAPDLHTNVALRLNLAAGPALIAAAEICNGEEIPSAEFDHPAVQAIREMTSLFIGWANDLYSFSKDAHDGGGTNNLVTCLQRERQCSPQEAVAEAVSVWNRTMLLFLRLRAQQATHGSAPLRRLMDDCGRMIGNVLPWHAASPRYRRASAPLAITPGPLAQVEPDPVDIPGLSWWWQQLT